MITIASLEELASRQTLTPDTRMIRERLSILFMAKGSGRCRQGGEVLVLTGKTVYTGGSDCFRQFELEKDAAGYLIAVDPEKLGTIFEGVTISYKDLFALNGLCLPLDDESVEEMNWLVTRIVKKAGSKENYKLEIVQKYVSLLMLQLKSKIKDELVQVSMSRKGMLIKDFFSLLEDTFMKAKTVDYYAGKLCVSPKHLTNVIKLESGHPTSYHINQRIVFEAKRIARTSGASLKQIAYELGYEDAAAFSKLFKRVTGENFSSYKCNLKFAFRNTAKSLHEITGFRKRNR